MRETPAESTDSTISRGPRQDTGFRQRLLAESLELLLGELGKLQRAANNAGRADQVREGVELALKLADLLQRLAPDAPRAA